MPGTDRLRHATRDLPAAYTRLGDAHRTPDSWMHQHGALDGALSASIVHGVGRSIVKLKIHGQTIGPFNGTMATNMSYGDGRISGPAFRVRTIFTLRNYANGDNYGPQIQSMEFGVASLHWNQ
jgi:hypothetical protein